MAVKKKSNKYNSKTIIFLATILVIFLVFFSYKTSSRPSVGPAKDLTSAPANTPTIAPNASDSSSIVLPWTAYSHPNLDISFKYPKIYYQYLESGKTNIYLAPSKGIGGKGPKYLNKSDEWIEISTGSPLNIPADADKKPVVADGMSGYEFLTSMPSAADNLTRYFYIAWFTVNKRTYTITLNSWDENSIKKSGDFFSQFLSTIKFGQTGLDTTNWKTFSTSNLYSLKYPKDTEVITNIYKAIKPGIVPVCDPFNTSLCLSISNDYFPGTSFKGAGLAVAVLPLSKNDSSDACINTDQNVSNLGDREIGSYKYHVYSRNGTALGTQSNENIYYLYRNDHCFKITSRILTGLNNPNEQTGDTIPVSNNDLEYINRLLNNIVTTLNFR